MSDIPRKWETVAYPGIPEVRFVRAIYGLCPYCNHARRSHVGDEGQHECVECPERITRGAGDDDWIYCLCGNDPSGEGFCPCLEDGTEVEPTVDGPWQGKLYRCDRCGRIVDQETLLVTGYHNIGGEF